MVNNASFQYKTKAFAHRNTSLKWCHGTLESYAFSHASYLLKSAGFQRVVLKSILSVSKSKQKFEPQSCSKAIVNSSSFSFKKNEKRRGKTIAWKNWAYSLVQFI